MPATNNTPAKRAKPDSRSNRAGLNLLVGRIHRILKSGNYAPRLGTKAAVYMTAVLEYLAAEIMKLAGIAANDDKTSILSHHIMMAIRKDVELNQLLRKKPTKSPPKTNSSSQQ